MKCARCGLYNPGSAQRCDCGYDFEKRTVEEAYFKQELPKQIKTYLLVTIGANVALGLVVLEQGDAARIVATLVWSVVVYWLYWRLVKKDNWARIAIVILTLPIGLFLGLSREAKLYCLQK